jgi:tetratricopeptide (TPR) repeat protein
MIAPSTISDKSKEASVPPTFRIDPPSDNPFVAASPVSLTEGDGQPGFGWLDVFRKDSRLLQASEIARDMIDRSRREADVRPLSARAHGNLGLALLGASRLDEAAYEFQIALRLQPQHYIAAINLARVRVEKGEYDDAERLYKDLLQTYPDDPPLLMSLAHLAMRRADYNKAVSLLTQVTTLDEDAVLPKYHLAVALLAIGKQGEAIGLLRAATRSDVRSAALYHALGVAYALGGQPGRAVRSFKSALKLSPELAEPARALARLMLGRGDLEAANELLTDYLERNPEDFAARELLARVYIESKRHSFARSQLLRVWEQTKSSEAPFAFRASVANNIGASLDFDGNNKEAFRWFLRSIDLSPDFSPVPYNNLARLYAREKNIPSALTVLAKCKTHFPEDPATSFLVSVCLSDQERYKEAVIELEPSIELGKAPVEAYAHVGGLLAVELHDPDRACTVLRNGHRAFPKNRLVANNLAYALLLRGEIGEARKVLESTAAGTSTLEPRNEVAITATWGLLRLLEGKLPEGERLYTEAEALAKREGQKDLALQVSQKMALELARAHARLGNLQSASRWVQQGLAVAVGRKAWRRDLEELERTLKNDQKQPGG